MNYYLNVSLIGSSTKKDRCQDVKLLKMYFYTETNFKYICQFYWIYEYF